MALVALVLIVLIAILSIPAETDKVKTGPSIVAIATAAFGVIGATVGGFFAVKSANQAVDQVRKQDPKRDPPPGTG